MTKTSAQIADEVLWKLAATSSPMQGAVEGIRTIKKEVPPPVVPKPQVTKAPKPPKPPKAPPLEKSVSKPPGAPTTDNPREQRQSAVEYFNTKTSSRIADEIFHKIAAHMVKQVTHDLVRKRPLDSTYLTNEVGEFVDAFKRHDLKGVREELQDVMFGAQMLAHQATKRDFPIIGADEKIKEFYRRKDAFESMFKEKGLRFHTNYYVGGSNIQKPEKIQKAFQVAGHPISLTEAEELSRRYSNHGK